MLAGRIVRSSGFSRALMRKARQFSLELPDPLRQRHRGLPPHVRRADVRGWVTPRLDVVDVTSQRRRRGVDESAQAVNKLRDAGVSHLALAVLSLAHGERSCPSVLPPIPVGLQFHVGALRDLVDYGRGTR